MKYRRHIVPYGQKRRHFPNPHYHNKPPALVGRSNETIFKGNLVDSMKFGSQGHELSGYVQRKVVLIDQHGNKQIATEKQFFNSAKRLGRIRIADDEGEF
jgi:hypothetical protein